MDTQTDTRWTGPYAESLRQYPDLPALTVLAHPDPERVGDVVVLQPSAAGTGVRLSRVEPDFAPPDSSLLRPLGDPHLSRKPILLDGGARGVQILRAQSRTDVEVDGEALGESHKVSADELQRGVVLVLGHRLALLLHLAPAFPQSAPAFGLVGEAPAMVRVRQEIEMVGELDTPVLLRGESGTGKELVARAIHRAGPRRLKDYVPLNMAAVPTSLAAAELFGAARGAYTGADRRRVGFFQKANGGTLFLDEIGETPADVQPLLLRALESGEIQPVGGAQAERVDVRVIAATDASLEEMIRSGRFRAPLLHRLAGYELRLPPLRERRSDIGRLLYHFLRLELEAVGEVGLLEQLDAGRPWPPADVVARLARYDWPGNVRELRNAARRMVIARRAASPALGASLLEQLLRDVAPAESPASAPEPVSVPATEEGVSEVRSSSPEPAPSSSRSWRPVYRRLPDVPEAEILEALRAHGYQPKAAAAALGVSRGALYDFIARSDRVRKAADLEESEIRAALEKHPRDLDAAAAALEVSRPGLKRRMKALGLR